MEKLVLQAIEKFSLLKKYDSVTVALSGGADSVSLLHVLSSLSRKLEITLNAAHLNHSIRGAEADRDQAFCQELCDKLGIKLFVQKADIPSISKQSGESIELCARRVRYECLAEVSNGGLVATAHTARDNLETMIFNLARGTAIDGLCGIPPKRGNFIRPLIFATREDVESYCLVNNISYVTDSTNLSDDYTRNKIRHNVIPVLKEINPLAEASALKTAIYLRENSDFLKLEANEFLDKNLIDRKKLDLTNFGSLNNAVKANVIIAFVKSQCPTISLESVHITEILKICDKSGKTSLPKDMYIENFKGSLSVKSKHAENNTQFTVNIEEICNDFFKNSKKINNLLLNNLIDCDKIVGNVVQRTRKTGDSIRIFGRGCTKTLNKWFNEIGIRPEERDFIPLISDDKGLIWVYGLGVAQRCAVTKSTKRILKIDTRLKGE